ncbi:amino acid permease, partial [Trypanosoma cruzi]
MSTNLRTYASDDPLNDGVELVEDLQGQAGLPTGDRMDVAKIRIEKLNQERQERVARRRDPQSCLKRGLHRIIPYGGIISSGCNLASSSLGAGILALPYAFNTSGLAMALVYLVVVGLLTIYSFTLLGIAGKRTGCGLRAG